VGTLGWRMLKGRERRGTGGGGGRGDVRLSGPPEGGTPYEALGLGLAQGEGRQGCRGAQGLKGGGVFNHERHESPRKGKVRVVVAGFHSFSCTFENFVVR